MGFEYNPADEDPHGECRHEIHRLQDEVKHYKALLIACAEQLDPCDVYLTPETDEPIYEKIPQLVEELAQRLELELQVGEIRTKSWLCDKHRTSAIMLRVANEKPCPECLREQINASHRSATPDAIDPTGV